METVKELLIGLALLCSVYWAGWFTFYTAWKKNRNRECIQCRLDKLIKEDDYSMWSPELQQQIYVVKEKGESLLKEVRRIKNEQ
jgi:hypothetical protein